jgi:nucleotidyltransferase substrate binding protein (TIGR01987 family)
MELDIRWRQRLDNYQKALAQLTRFIEQDQLNELEEQGLIKAFEYTYELSWKVIKDYYEAQGEVTLQGSRDAFRLAFQRGLITEGQSWMAMIKSRIATVHTYNPEIARRVAQDIRETYFPLFQDLNQILTAL